MGNPHSFQGREVSYDSTVDNGLAKIADSWRDLPKGGSRKDGCLMKEDVPMNRNDMLKLAASTAVAVPAAAVILPTLPAWGMESRIDPTVKMDNGSALYVTGPITFDSNEVAANVQVTIVQGKNIATGISGRFLSGSTVWHAKALALRGDVFVPGTAQAHATAIVVLRDESIEWYDWSNEVTLVM
jgi:hypothetical protein